jgi:polysaccharide biosynthesis transport protein
MPGEIWNWNHPRDGKAPGEGATSEVVGLGLGQVMLVLARRWWLILGVGAITLAIGWLLVPRNQSSYSAMAVVRLTDPHAALTGGLDGGSVDNLSASDFLVSQVHVIRSRAVVGEVVDRAGLRVHAGEGLSPRDLRDADAPATALVQSIALDFAEDGFTAHGDGGSVSAAYGVPLEINGVRFSVAARPDEARGSLYVVDREEAIDLVLAGLAVEPRLRSTIIDIQYTDPSPARAQRVVNELAESFRAHNTRGVQMKSQRRRMFIEEQLGQTEQRLADAQLALSSSRGTERLYSSREKLASEQAGLMNLEVRREELDAERRMLQSMLANMERLRGAEREEAIRTLVSAPGIVSNPVVTSTYSRLVQYQTERENLAAGTWGRSESHPDVERLTALTASAERQLTSAVRSHLLSLDARVRSLDELRGRSATVIRGLPAAETEETRLTQQVQTISRMADLLREEYQRARIAEAVEDGQVEILDLASTAFPSRNGRRPQVLMISLMFGMMMGAGGALLMETANRSIRHREEMDSVLHVPSLAVVPRWTAAGKPDKTRPALLPRRLGPAGGTRPDAMALVTLADSASGGAEAYRILRSNLSSMRAGETLKLLVVTSPGIGEGKSTTAANLAVTFARQGMRVLVIDADLRRPRLFKLLGGSRGPGFTDLIVGRSSAAEAIQQTDVPNLYLLSSGPPDAEALEQLGSIGVRELLRRLCERFDMIVIDTPPLLAGADASDLGAAADGVLLVVRAGSTARVSATHALAQLNSAGATVVGSVLNDPDETVENYGNAYYPTYYAMET